MLYVKTEGDSASEIEAQTVSSDVNDSDFTLPYEIKSCRADSAAVAAQVFGRIE